MAEQNYQNHTQRPSGFLALALTILVCFIGAGVNLYESFGDHQRLYSASLILVLTLCVFFTLAFARTFALKVQDRAIRSEESLRHYILTGKPLDSRLGIRQIIALRFASDAEFPELAQRAAAGALSADDIKRAVKNWRADTYRV
jgi:hypothetical protein